MEITEEQYARVKDCLPVQRGNVSLSNLHPNRGIFPGLDIGESASGWHGCVKKNGPQAIGKSRGGMDLQDSFGCRECSNSDNLRAFCGKCARRARRPRTAQGAGTNAR